MRQRYPNASVKVICELFGKSRQAHYKQTQHEEKLVMKNAIIIKRVKEIRSDMPRIGTRKLYYLLAGTIQDHGIEIGRDSLFNLLSLYGMLVNKRKKHKRITTDSNHPFWKYPNLIRDVIVNRPNMLWVSDITYITLSGGYCYLSLVTDAYSRKIVGWKLHPTLEKAGPLDALNMALATRIDDLDYNNQLIHHSDRGMQYCCHDYIYLLTENNITISMTEMGDPYENAIAERINGILKTEFGLGNSFRSHDAANKIVTKSIMIYNEKRPHSSCDYLTPAQAHQQIGYLQSKWKSNKTAATHAT